MNAVTTTSVTTRGGYSSVKLRQPQMQPQPQQMTDHHHTQRQMLPDQQHIQGYSSQHQQHLSNNTGELTQGTLKQMDGIATKCSFCQRTLGRMTLAFQK